jgi:hypothetical protein
MQSFRVVVVIGDGGECVFALFRLQIIKGVVDTERDTCGTTLVPQPGPVKFGDVLSPDLDRLAGESFRRFHDLAQSRPDRIISIPLSERNGSENSGDEHGSEHSEHGHIFPPLGHG